MHICVSNLAIIGADNGLMPGRLQPIIWTNAGISLIGPLGTNFSEILIEICTFAFKKMHLKMTSAKWRTYCLWLKILYHGCWWTDEATLIGRFIGPTWGPSRADRTQVGPMLAPWTLLSGKEPGHHQPWCGPHKIVPPQHQKLLTVASHEHHNISNRCQLNCLFNYFSRLTTKKKIKALHQWPIEGNPPVFQGIPSQRANNVESFLWHDKITQNNVYLILSWLN